ncbi:hypothetical protein BJY04DRAFT_210759 [Aspergillus karnatakaensis]|uniref:uncharacterized protein n=1 Tax=Aspergillus karnatakaensis TaxID=1810916 RepID=UPI003CCCDA32
MVQTQKAVIIKSEKQGALVTDRPIPKLRDDYILVKTVAVALNPTDWKHIEFLAPPGVLVGCDYAGIVEAVGKDVKKPFKKGDRVAGFVHGSNAVQPEDGAFAEYIVAKGDIQIKIPNNLSFQEAATLGVGITTVGQGLYQSLKLAPPETPTKEALPVLIYGGSTATGTLAIQFAKLSGYTVITTCSPRNFDLVKSLGADAVYDYNDPNAAAEIRKYTDNKLKYVFDTISLEASSKFCDEALSTEGGEYSSLLVVPLARENVNDRWTLGYTAAGEAFNFGPTHWPAKPEDKEFAQKFWDNAAKLLGEGKVKVHPPSVQPGGLNGVLEGLKLLKEDKKVLIIGATSGIGKALAARFVQENVSLVIAGRREQNLNEFKQQHSSANVTSVVFDITKLDEIPSFLSTIFTTHPDIDCVFINSGIQRPFDFSAPSTVNLTIFDQELLVNYTAAVHFTKSLLPYLQAQTTPTAIAYTTSQMALVPMMRCPNYGASKAALHHFILALRTQLKTGPGDVKVIEVFPPAVQTELHDEKHQPDLRDGGLIGMPVGEFVEELWDGFVEGEEQIAVGSAREVFEGFEWKRQEIYERMTVMLGGLLKRFLK